MLHTLSLNRPISYVTCVSFQLKAKLRVSQRAGWCHPQLRSQRSFIDPRTGEHLDSALNLSCAPADRHTHTHTFTLLTCNSRGPHQDGTHTHTHTHSLPHSLWILKDICCFCWLTDGWQWRSAAFLSLIMVVLHSTTGKECVWVACMLSSLHYCFRFYLLSLFTSMHWYCHSAQKAAPPLLVLQLQWDLLLVASGHVFLEWKALNKALSTKTDSNISENNFILGLTLSNSDEKISFCFMCSFWIGMLL